MATGILIGMAAVSLIGVGYGLYTLNQMKGVAPEVTDMQPNSFDSFQITKVQEGAVVTEILGRVRLTGNLVWYGNLRSEPQYDYVTSQVQDGKDTKTVTQEYIKGYNNYVGMLQILCKGPATWVQTWSNDSIISQPLPNSSSVLATGEGNVFPDTIIDVPYQNDMEGVAWIYSSRFFLGFQTTSVPTLHFLMECLPDIVYNGVKFEANGINPAYAIYYKLLSEGESPSNINMQSFIDSGNYWHDQGYGINVSITRQMPLREVIKKILSYVSGFYGIDTSNRHYLKAFDPNEESIDDFVEDDFLSFSLVRKTWEDTNNVFNGNYLDEELSYTKRTVCAVNQANIEIQGVEKPVSIDLSAFRDRESAEKRIWEIMKEQSYPGATAAFSTFMHKAEVEAGSVISITNSEFGLQGSYFRIIEKNLSELDKNRINFTAHQVVERMFDGNYASTPGSVWTEPEKEPQAPEYQRVFELPWLVQSGDIASYLLLSTRGSAYETGFQAMISSEIDGEYESRGSFGDNALRGHLEIEYPANTNNIDDEIGVYFIADTDYPTFESITRTQLFGEIRHLLIGDELMCFQNIEPYGENGFYITGVIRGLHNTPIQTHIVDKEAWIVRIGGNVITNLPYADYYIKMAPIAAGNMYPIEDLTAIHVTSSNKAKTPYRIPRVVGERIGEEIIVPGGSRYLMIKAFDTHGGSYMSLRDMRFYKDGVLIPYSVTWSIAATSSFSSSQGPVHIFNQSSLTGGSDYAQWTSSGAGVNQIITVDFGEGLDFDAIQISNAHISGNYTDRGIQNVEIHVTSEAPFTTGWADIQPEAIRIFSGIFNEHVSSDVADTYYLSLDNMDLIESGGIIITPTDQVEMTWWPITKTYDGAGVNDPGSVTDFSWPLSDHYPMDFDGIFDYRIDGGDWQIFSGTNLDITNAEEFTFEIRNTINGVQGEITTLTVGTDAGQYKAD